jgi:radical SAM superfamily enzyme YgiQ (UPF0313 family)
VAAARRHAPPDPTAFFPTARAEMTARGWDELDVLLITRDAYVDHPSFGAALVGRVLEAAGKAQDLGPYFISSFPGCTDHEMGVVEKFLRKERWTLQQAQDFIPLPMTGAAAMYVTSLAINSGRPLPIVRNAEERERQKRALRPRQAHRPRTGPLDTVD